VGVSGVDKISLSKLDRMSVVGGDVMHGLKSTDPGFVGFGELYFSNIHSGCVKGWKRHTRMTLNLVVPIGEVHFVFIDEEAKHREEWVGEKNHVRLTVPPNIWFAFKGTATSTSLIVNLADIQHDPEEVERMELEQIPFDWGIE
jgi:dTDP-4-dehydrorhamnose 3,5-epimerase